MKTQILEEIGYTPRDVFFSMGYSGPDDPRIKQYIEQAYPEQPITRRVLLWRTKQDAEVRGKRVALSMISRKLLAEGYTPHFNDLLLTMVREGIEQREYGLVDSRYKSEGLVEDMSETVGLNPVEGRNVLQGMRFNGLYLARTEKEPYIVLTNQIQEFIDATRTLAPTKRRIKLDGMDDPLHWYITMANSAGRTVGAMLPYELPYWEYILNAYRGRMLPFTKIVLDYFAQPNLFPLNERDGKYVKEIRKQWNIPIDRHTMALTLKNVAADLPMGESISWEQ